MNPRVSRSSALASKATGFPIAKLAALLAVGYTLDELPNDITGVSSAAFEPALDYVAVKAPRFDFDKFPGNSSELGTEMRAVGEALGIGRTLPEALLKALEGVEAGDALPEIPGLHPYFAAELASIRAAEQELAATGDVAAAKRFGLPDARIAGVLGVTEAEVRAGRGRPGRLAVDSCAGEFEARTPYYYLSHEQGDGDETAPGAIVVLGSGTNRIGQGIEFDYCCVRAAQAFRRLGHEVVLVNSNPETVSTDYDTCDRLYLEPVTLERVLDVVALERPLGVVVSLGGQTPLGLAAGLAEAGVPLLGDPARARSTSPRTAAASARCSRSSACGARPGRTPRRRPRRARSRTSSAIPCSSAPPTSSAAAACASRAARRSSSSPALPSSTASSRARSSSTSTCSATARTAGSRRSSSTSSAPASTRATRPASCPRRRWASGSRRRSGSSRRRSSAASAHAACSTCSSRCTTATSTCSRRTRARRGRCRSWPRRPGSRSSTTPAGCCWARALAELDLPERAVPDARLGEGGDLPLRALHAAPPTAASRCARPAR